VLVDVRPREEYDAGHIEGARSIPLAELERRLAELPPDTEVVAYCRGPFCAEIDRVLRPGGRLQLADVIIHTAVSQDARERIDLWTG
jgi:hypothetical protein